MHARFRESKAPPGNNIDVLLYELANNGVCSARDGWAPQTLSGGEFLFVAVAYMRECVCM